MKSKIEDIEYRSSRILQTNLDQEYIDYQNQSIYDLKNELEELKKQNQEKLQQNSKIKDEINDVRNKVEEADFEI